jgi:transcriptional regulator with XRE-family HTH domain
MVVDGGRTLRRFRDAADLTQRQVADRVGVNPQTVSQWERDEVVPRRAKVVRLDELFVAQGAILAAFGYNRPDDIDRLSAYVLDNHAMIRALVARVDDLTDEVRRLQQQVDPRPVHQVDHRCQTFPPTQTFA